MQRRAGFITCVDIDDRQGSLSVQIGFDSVYPNPLTAYTTKSQHDFLAGVEAYATRATTHDQPHATIRIYPYVTAFGHGQLSPRPMNIKQINEVIIDPKDTFSQVYELKMPFEKINVPAGEQTIIAGTHRDQHIKFTMNFVDGKDYKPEKVAAAVRRGVCMNMSKIQDLLPMPKKASY